MQFGGEKIEEEEYQWIYYQWITWILKGVIISSLFLLIGLQALRFNEGTQNMLAIYDERSDIIMHAIIACICFSSFLVLKQDSLTLDTILSSPSRLIPNWIILPVGIVLFLGGFTMLYGWTTIPFVQVSDDVSSILPLLAPLLFLFGVAFISIPLSVTISLTISNLSKENKSTSPPEKYPWPNVHRAIAQEYLTSDLLLLKNNLNNTISNIIDLEIRDDNFDFSDGHWNLEQQRKIILEGHEDMEIGYGVYNQICDMALWELSEESKIDFLKYLDTEFSRKVSGRQLSYYASQHFKDPAISEGAIRNLLWFERSEDKSICPSNYFISDNIGGRQENNLHYLKLKLSIAALFVDGLVKFSQAIFESKENFSYDFFRSLIVISMKGTDRNECPALGDVGFATSDEFHNLNFGGNGVLDWQLAFENHEVVSDQLYQLLLYLSRYGYGFPDMARGREEQDHSFWDVFWENLRWSVK